VPSTRESFGGVFTEAWTFGRPVIGGNIAPVREVIADGEDGFVVAQTPSVIAERVAYLLEHPDEAGKMGAAGRTKVAANYSWPALAAKTEQIYESLA
jgi:glycosyltransferase involved in cell wall biosynthesis